MEHYLQPSAKGGYVLIPSWLGWVLEPSRMAGGRPRSGLNPFLVRVGVGTYVDSLKDMIFCLNPFLVRVGVGTSVLILTDRPTGLNPFLVRVGVGTLAEACLDLRQS